MAYMTKPGFRRSRSSIAGEARIRSARGDWTVPLLDVSLTGANVPCPAGCDLPVGSGFELELRAGPREATVQLVLRGRVARRGDGRLGLSFDRLSPLLERELQGLLDAHGTLRDDAEDAALP